MYKKYVLAPILLLFMTNIFIINIFASSKDTFYSDGFFVDGVEVNENEIYDYTKPEAPAHDSSLDKMTKVYQKTAHLKSSTSYNRICGYWLLSAAENIEKLDLSKIFLNDYDKTTKYCTLFCTGAFKDKANLKYVYCSQSYTYIDKRAFENCSVQAVRIPQSEHFKRHVYWNSPYQGWMLLDLSVQECDYSIICSEAFVNCPNLTSVIIDGMETTIEDNAFVNCGDITIYCPESSKAENFAKRNGYKYKNISSVTIYPSYHDYLDTKDWIKPIIEKKVEITEMEKQIFDEELYLLYNPDLVDSPFDSEELLYAHWLANGMQSGGSHIFDVEYYLNANPDLKKAFGDNKEAAYRHFLSNGYKELRDSSPEYCGKAYKNRYKDLADMTSEQLINHYLSYGINAGRNAAAERVLKYGDVNCDGVLTSADSAYIMQKVLNSDFKLPVEIYEKNYKKYADVDGDDRITANDSACIMQKVLNSSYKMPVEFT